MYAYFICNKEHMLFSVVNKTLEEFERESQSGFVAKHIIYIPK